MWSSDAELFGLIRTKLFTAVIGDILDELGFVHQFLPPVIRPLRDDMVVVGRALPVLAQDLADAGDPARPFGAMLDALDDLKPGEVYLASGGSVSAYAMWGELMSTRARALGAAGAVLNGCSRDTRGILAMDFPVFSAARYAQDQRGRGTVVDFRLPIQIGAVLVEPGDILFGDIDGVLAIPRTAEREALTRALEKVDKENLVREAIAGGMSAADAFALHGVL